MKQCTNLSCGHWYERQDRCPKCATKYGQDRIVLEAGEGKSLALAQSVKVVERKSDGSVIDAPIKIAVTPTVS